MTPARGDIAGRIGWHKARIGEAEERRRRELLAAHAEPTDLGAAARLRAISDEIAGHCSAIDKLTEFAH